MACNSLSGVGPLLYCMAIGLPKIFYNNAFAVKMFVATGRKLGCVDGRGVASPRQLKRSNHPEHGFVA